MKKLCFIFVIFSLFVFASCGGSKKSDDNSAESNCEYGEYQCRGDESYFCDYSENLTLTWTLLEECSNGCDEQTGECISDPDSSDGEDTSDTESDEEDTDEEDTDDADSTSDGADSTSDDGDTTSDDGDSTSDDADLTSDDADSTSDDDHTEALKEGVYLGIIGFNQTVPPKTFPISSLKDNLNNYYTFINGLTTELGTALYYAEYYALNMLENKNPDYTTPIPPNLKTVALVTFTDGLDNTSTSGTEFDPENYSEGGKAAKYRDALSKRIKEKTILDDQKVVAYSVGLKGKDWDSSDVSEFKDTLQKLASRDGNVFEISDIDKVNERFKKIANELYSETTTKNLDVKIPGGYDDTWKVRLTFDIYCDEDSGECEANGADSRLYIEATYGKPNLNERYLRNITYAGLLEKENETTITGSKDPGDSYYHFLFKGLVYDKTVKVEVSDGSEDQSKNDQARDAGAITEDESHYIIENIDAILAAVAAQNEPDITPVFEYGEEGDPVPVTSGSTEETKNNKARNAGAISSTDAQYVITNIDAILAQVEARKVPAVVFHKEKTNEPLSASDAGRIRLWKKTSSSGNWVKESEFKPKTASNVSEEKSSALIMLVLDCTTSLGNGFATMKNAARNFVTTLNGGTGGSSSADLPECSDSSGTPCYNSTYGLIWSKKLDDGGYSWSSAQSKCSSHSESGISGWRLPTISELRTLVQGCPYTQHGSDSCNVYYEDEYNYCLSEEGCYTSYCGSCSGNTIFGSKGSGWHWSLSPVSDNPGYAWALNFSNANIVEYSKTDSNGYVRCVK